jgi:hypothetical protein
MSKPIIDPASVAKLRADLHAARDGLITDRVVALAHALETLLDLLERGARHP